MTRLFAPRSLLFTLITLVAVFTLGCGGGGGGSGSGGDDFGVSDKGQIQIEHGGANIVLAAPDTIKFQKGQVEVGATITETLIIRNVAVPSEGKNAPLNVTLKFDYTAPPGVDESQGPSLRVKSIEAGASTVTETDGTYTVQILPPERNGDEIEVVLEFLRYEDSTPRTANLSVVSDTLANKEKNVNIPFSSEEGNPVANVQPKLIDFGQVKQGEVPKKPITVSNTGSDPLVVSNVLFQGHPDYVLEYLGVQYEPGEEIKFDPAIIIEPGKFATFVVIFDPLTDVPAEGKVVFYTNDSEFPSGILVEIKANTEGPCIQVNPKKVQFGGKLVGNKAVLPVEVISCGTADLLVTNMVFTDGSNANFQLDYKTLPGFEDNAQPSADKILTVPINQKATFHVEYTPSIENPLGEDGQPVFDVGIILVESNAFDAQLEVEVSGLGVEKECPTAVGIIQEGEQVIPQTNLHLFGDQSFAPAGVVYSFKWGVQQPTGSASLFVPSDTFPNPTFETNTAGEYQFSLEVWDEAGVKSCVPWKQTVLVVPDEAIHVELLWHTPNDPDETDQGPEAGSDVDLHFTHDKYAQSGPDIDQDGTPDGWFDQPFDCFWFNAHPNWGSFDPSIDDDPGLDRDDTDGAGPENLNLNIPENTLYRVGVHYWSDHEYGPSFITLRIYIYSNLVFEVTDVKLVNHDMWDAATIEWPSGKVTLVQQGGGGYKITPNYQNPFFFQP